MLLAERLGSTSFLWAVYLMYFVDGFFPWAASSQNMTLSFIINYESAVLA